MSAFVIALIAGFLVLVLSQFIFSVLAGNPGKEKINTLAEEMGQYNDPQMGSDTPIIFEGELTPTAQVMQKILEGFGFDMAKYRHEKGMLYYQAGYQSASAPVYFVYFKWVAQPVIGLLAIYLILQENATLDIQIAGFIFALLAVKGADLILENNKKKRQKRLQNSFPDAIDLLLVCVETGLALDGALARVCRELGHAHPEITSELNRLRMELSLLNDRQKAMQNLAIRTDLAPFKTLVGALIQTERMGSSLTDTLRILSDDYRMRRLMDAENRAGKLPALMTIPLIFFFLPAFFVIIVGPIVIQVKAM